MLLTATLCPKRWGWYLTEPGGIHENVVTKQDLSEKEFQNSIHNLITWLGIQIPKKDFFCLYKKSVSYKVGCNFLLFICYHEVSLSYVYLIVICISINLKVAIGFKITS